MDSWTDKQIKMMRLGGNQRFIDFCKEHGIAGMGIKDKYHTPAAELYRLQLVARRDGTPEPTELPKPAAPARRSNGHGSGASRAGNGSSSSSSGGGGGGGARPGETPIERELRLREEARERLRQKFGEGGLKGVAVGSTPTGFGSSPMPAQSSNDDFFSGELAETGTKAVAAAGKVAGSAWSMLAGAAKATAAFTAEVSRDVATKVNEGHLGEKISGGVSNVGKSIASVADPHVVSSVKDTAAGWFGAAATGATSLWSKASSASEDFLKTFEGAGSEEAPPMGGGAPRTAAPGAPRAAAPPRPAPARSSEDDEWLQQQLADAQRKLGTTSVGGSTGSNGAVASSEGGGGGGGSAAADWHDDGWGDEWGDDDHSGGGGSGAGAGTSAAAPAAPAVPTAAATTTPEESPEEAVVEGGSGAGNDDDDDADGSAYAAPPAASGSPPRKLPVKKRPVVADDEDDGWDDW